MDKHTHTRHTASAARMLLRTLSEHLLAKEVWGNNNGEIKCLNV